MRLSIVAWIVALSGCSLLTNLNSLAIQDVEGAASDATASDAGCPPNSDPSLLVYWRFDEGSGNTVADCSGIDDTLAYFRVGCRSDNSAYFNGIIDEVRLYDRELTSIEIAALANP